MAEMVVGFEPADIRKMYAEYVQEWDGRNRQTPEAWKTLDQYDAYTRERFPMSSQIQGDLYDRMMECAVAFEESGFIGGFGAGFRCAIRLLQGDSGAVPFEPISNTPTPERTQHGPIQASTAPSGLPLTDTSAHGVRRHEQGTASAVISSRQIAEIFETSNWKVVRRIDLLLPELDTQSRSFFCLKIESNVQRRKYRIYYLNRAACDIYLDRMEPYKKYINVMGGMTKMRELMNTMISSPSGSVSLP